MLSSKPPASLMQILSRRSAAFSKALKTSTLRPTQKSLLQISVAGWSNPNLTLHSRMLSWRSLSPATFTARCPIKEIGASGIILTLAYRMDQFNKFPGCWHRSRNCIAWRAFRTRWEGPPEAIDSIFKSLPNSR
jgi:hypothetical protein